MNLLSILNCIVRVDWEGPTPEDLGDNAESVAVPESLIEISDECLEPRFPLSQT